MKDVVKENRRHRLKHKSGEAKAKFSVFTACFLLFTFCLLAASGCNGPTPTTINWPGTVFTGDLVPEATRIVLEGLTDDNPFVRANAAEVVATTKQVRLMPKVQRLLRDEFVPVRFAAALAVGDTQYSLAEDSVSRLSSDEDENVRIAAAYALSRLGHSDSFELFRNALGSKDLKVRANAALLLGKSGDKSALRHLRWALWSKDSNDRVVFNAAEAMAMLGDEKIYPKIWTMLISTYPDVRVTGIRAMGALGTVQARDDLVRMLIDNVVEVRLAAAKELGALGDRIGEPAVLDVFTKNLTAGMNPEDIERVHVLTALAIGRIGTPRLTKFLPQLLRSNSKFVRLAAAKAVFQCVMQRQTAGKSRI